MKNIDKEFVPYQEALELNELGFDYQCVNYYSHYGNGQVHLNNLVLCSKIGVETNRDKGILAPLYQQAFRWFRENYGLKHDIDDDNVGTKFYYKIRSYTDKFDNYDDIIKPMREERDWSKIEFYSYEETELACLKKLIEIVKNK